MSIISVLSYRPAVLRLLTKSRSAFGRLPRRHTSWHIFLPSYQRDAAAQAYNVDLPFGCPADRHRSVRRADPQLLHVGSLCW